MSRWMVEMRSSSGEWVPMTELSDDSASIEKTYDHLVEGLPATTRVRLLRLEVQTIREDAGQRTETGD